WAPGQSAPKNRGQTPNGGRCTFGAVFAWGLTPVSSVLDRRLGAVAPLVPGAVVDGRVRAAGERERVRDGRRRDAAVAVDDDRAVDRGDVDAGVGERPAQLLGRPERAVVDQQLAVGDVDRAGDVPV